jgi:hypothetical protein
MTDHEESHHRPHGHHHAKDSSPDEARQHRQAESQAQPFVDDCAPEREEMRSAIHAGISTRPSRGAPAAYSPRPSATDRAQAASVTWLAVTGMRDSFDIMPAMTRRVPSVYSCCSRSTPIEANGRPLVVRRVARFDERSAATDERSVRPVGE